MVQPRRGELGGGVKARKLCATALYQADDSLLHAALPRQLLLGYPGYGSELCKSCHGVLPFIDSFDRILYN